MRIKILIGIAALLLLAAGASLLFPGSDPDDNQDEVVRKVHELAAAENVDGLAEQARSKNQRAAEMAVLAMGKVGKAARTHIERAMTDERPGVREKAATAFSQVAVRQEADKLAQIAKTDKSANVRAAAISGLRKMQAFQEMEAVLRAMEDPDPIVRRRASLAATKFAGVTVQYDPEGSPEQIRQGALRMRQYWEREKPGLIRYWNELLSAREQAGRPGQR